MRAADLLTLMINSPTKVEYKRICLSNHEKVQPLTSIYLNEKNQCVFVFEQKEPPMSIKKLLLFLMKNREKDLFYQKEQQIHPLYGLKETGDQWFI
ncbi:hypothetical protein [Enterococcus ratti]|uniref:Uncharacterized protein n=1 Tax=Enterococcus ratti TaxID=150033 RepID=A0A1L8WLI2_9ENTE|nr:hypothetical protein [Enterococcus ratti]OJG81861.1 hypothetical protein RV14_GL002404 [Enterococcus ratti]